MGATFFTGISRGIGGAILFGFLAWGVGSLLMQEDQKEDKGTQLDQTA